MYNDPNQPPYGQPQQPQQPQSPYNQPPTQYPGSSTPYGLPPTQYAGPSNPYEVPPSNPYEMPPAQYAGPTPYNVPPAPVPGFAQPQLQPKRSRRWLWITLGIVGGLLALSCAGCTIFWAFRGSIFGQTTGPTAVANFYYTAIVNKDYTQAYSYLDSNLQTSSGQPVTQDFYTTAAEEKDTIDGPVTYFTQTDYSAGNGTASITMSVTRGSFTYDVHLQLQQDSNNNWVITSYDNI